MARLAPLFFAFISIVSVTHSANAAPLIRDASLFENFTIEGVSLSMSAQAAFDILKAKGYQAGSIERYEDWGEGSLNLVFGTYGGPEGYSSITLGRADGRLALISQSFNKNGINVGAEIGSAQSHFGIAADETDCRVNAAGTGGSCQVRDAEDRNAATMIFTMTAQSMMILRSISRPKELVDTLE